MSEIDESEALEAVAILKQKVNYLNLIVIIIVAIAGPALTWLLATSILAPIKIIVQAVNHLSDGEGDLTQIISAQKMTKLVSLEHN
jgi:methyl-accepting chemotaxis protein